MGERAQRRAQAAHADPHLVDAIRVGASHDADLVALHLRQAIAHNAPNPFLDGHLGAKRHRPRVHGSGGHRCMRRYSPARPC